MDIFGKCFTCFKFKANINREGNETTAERETEYNNLHENLMYNPPFNENLTLNAPPYNEIHENPTFCTQPYGEVHENRKNIENELNTSTLTASTMMDDTAEPDKGNKSITRAAQSSKVTFKVSAGGHKPPTSQPHNDPVTNKLYSSEIHTKIHGKQN